MSIQPPRHIITDPRSMRRASSSLSLSSTSTSRHGISGTNSSITSGSSSSAVLVPSPLKRSFSDSIMSCPKEKSKRRAANDSRLKQHILVGNLPYESQDPVIYFLNAMSGDAIREMVDERTYRRFMALHILDSALAIATWDDDLINSTYG